MSPTQLIIRFGPCSLVQWPSISLHLLILLRLKMWEYVCLASPYDSQFLNVSYPTYNQMALMFNGAAAFNQPVNFNTSSVENVRIFILSSPTMINPVLTTFLLFLTTIPIYYQMAWMFLGASAFNQPVRFNTAKVEDVRVICVQSNRANWETDYLTSCDG